MGAIQSSFTCCCPHRPKHMVVEEKDISETDSISRTKKKPSSTFDIDIKTGTNIIKRNTNPEDVYDQIKELGEGAFGRVIKVQHKKTLEFRAIKIIDKTMLLEDFQDSEIENEIDILKKLDHPNIIKVFEYYDYNNNIFIVNELIGDGDLYKLIEELKVLNEGLALRILNQMISAITYLHSEGVFHGDIKPENIMIDNYKKCRISNKASESEILGFDIKLIDFGTSKMFNKPKVFHNLVGTAYYVAPEVILGGYHKQCDLWSCGVVFYVMLTGCFPFNGETDDEIYQKIKYDKPNMNIKELKNISPESIDLLTQLLEKDPIERISAEKALEHSAFVKLKTLLKKCNQNLMHNNNSQMIMKKLKKSRTSKFHQAITAFITHNYLSKEVRLKHREIFKAIDLNGDGRITKEELIEGYAKIGCEYTTQEIEDIIANIDRDNNGFIEVEEFITASVDINVLLSDTNIKLAFETIDRDGSGLVSLDEVGKFVGGEDYDKDLIKLVIEEAGKDPEADITYDDFKAIMLTLKKDAKNENEDIQDSMKNIS
jgi:calcium-dependent protein kinase